MIGEIEMLLKLSKNTYVRTYGCYTYVLDRLTDSDRIFTNADVFMRWIGRSSVRYDELVKKIAAEYIDVSYETIANDFAEFIEPLISSGLVLSGETAEELESKERYFSYSSTHRKTVENNNITKEEFEKIPHVVLGNYFDENHFPMRLHIDVTQSCTERCIHCYIPEYNPIFLPYEKIKEVIDSFASMNGLHITFSGGECMMHPDFAKMLRYAHEKDLTIGILTNLTLCDDKMIELLKEVDATVQVSLYSMQSNVHDAITKLPGSWSRTMAALDKIHTANIPCFIACPTMKQNFGSYYDVVEYAKGRNMSVQVDFIIMAKTNGDTSNIPCRIDVGQARSVLHDLMYKALPVDSEYFSLAKSGDLPTNEEWANHPVCSAGLDTICLDATGNYYPCPGFAGFKLGSCFEHTLEWVWNESPEMLRLRSVRGRDFKKCVDCPDLNCCSVCMCRNFNETGDIFKPAEYFCDVAKINHEILNERINNEN